MSEPTQENEPYLAWDKRGYQLWGDQRPCWWIMVPKWSVLTYRHGQADWLINSPHRASNHMGWEHPFATFWTECHQHGMACHPLFALAEKKK
jgi:hypothetical protein